MMALLNVLIILHVLICLTECEDSRSSSSSEKTNLFISYIASLRPKTGFSAAGGLPALEMVIEIINNRSDILTNYSLQYTKILDSKCDQTTALDAFFQHFTRDNHTYIATQCCGCSVATIPVAEISHYWNIPQLDYSAALALSDRSRFRNFFRTVSTNRNLGFGYIRIASQFGWRKLLVISQNEELFTTLQHGLRLLYTGQNWIIDTSVLVDSSKVYSYPMDSIFKKIENEFYRIVLINTYSQFAHRVFCEAFHRNLFAPKVIWMTHLWYNKEWWKYFQSQDTMCTAKNVQVALKGSIGIIPNGYVLSESTMKTSSGLTANQFLDEYSNRFKKLQKEDPSVTPVSLPNLGFDLIWALALGLDVATKRVAQLNDSGCEDLPGEVVPLENFTYNNQKMGCILKQSIGSVEFDGLSGRIQFNRNGSQPDNLLFIQQYRELDDDFVERVTVAEIDTAINSFKFRSLNELWNELPYDGYPEEIIDQHSTALFAIYIIMIAAGLIFSITCLIFNVVFREKKVLKLSSPNLNYLIILGSIVLYCSVFTYVYMPPEMGQFTAASVICNLRVWLFSLGYTICFAVILAKTWRVYYIFNSPSPKKKIIKDWMLLIIIIVIVIIDLLILLLGTLINDSRLEANKISSMENPTEVIDGKFKVKYIYVCLRKGSGPIVWLSILFAYKGIIQIIGIFMAFHIRKVKIKALNDSKATAAIIYVNTIILITIIVVVFSLDDYHNGHAAIFGLSLLIVATLFLGVLFIPKMIKLYQDPMEKKIFEDKQNMSQIITFQTNTDTQERSKKDIELIAKLQEEIEELKRTFNKAPNISLET